MIGSKRNNSKVKETEKVVEKRKMEDIIKSLTLRLKNKSSDGCETRCTDESSKKDEEIQEFMKLLSESLTQKKKMQKNILLLMNNL